jgi:uncharacterized C2H2 Zn-finger protein
VECDTVFNSKYYFTNYNASHLNGVRVSSQGKKVEKEGFNLLSSLPSNNKSSGLFISSYF